MPRACPIKFHACKSPLLSQFLWNSTCDWNWQQCSVIHLANLYFQKPTTLGSICLEILVLGEIFLLGTIARVPLILKLRLLSPHSFQSSCAKILAVRRKVIYLSRRINADHWDKVGLLWHEGIRENAKYPGDPLSVSLTLHSNFYGKLIIITSGPESSMVHGTLRNKDLGYHTK